MPDTTIADVGETLVTLLRRNMNDFVDDPQQIALLSPAEAEGQDIRLTLFLYSIVENPYLKNSEGRLINETETRYPPLSVDLYYLLTSYVPEGIPDPTDRALQSHRVLGRAMRVFYDNGILAGTILQGELAGTGAELRLSLNPITVEDLTRIWSVFPNRAYRTSVSYLVTPAELDSERLLKAQRVVSKQADHDHMVPKRET
jgi:hypothetical protein